METLIDLVPPQKPPVVATGFSDYIRDLGDEINALLPQEAAELRDYLKSQGIEVPKNRA